MASNWNSYVDAILDADLNVAEHRLALALARLLCGWNRRGAYLGERILRDSARLDGRSFTRARDALVERDLLHYQPGSPGRGNRGLYELPAASEMPAPERALTEDEKPAVERVKPEKRKSPLSNRKKPAVERARRVKSREKTPGRDLTELRRLAFEAYLGAGGTLQLTKERGALARSVTTAAENGVADKAILDAIRDLGRKQEFPGLLKQRVQELEAAGGACEWEGLDRARLTPDQLRECSCERCKAWLEAAIGTTTATA